MYRTYSVLLLLLVYYGLLLVSLQSVGILAKRYNFYSLLSSLLR